MDITRRGFGGVLGGATMMLVLQGCGGDDDGDFIIGGNHANGPHSIFITAADLEKDGATFNIIGEAQHNHTVFFSKEKLLALKAGQRIESLSGKASDNSEHEHGVVVFAVAS